MNEKETLKVVGTLLLKRGLRDELEEILNNDILKKGEPVFEQDTFKLKIGDGVTPYKDLPYIGKFDKDEILEGNFDGVDFFDRDTNERVEGDTNKLYIDLKTNRSFRWGGSQYVEVSPSLQITEIISEASPDGMVPVARAVYAYGQELLKETETNDNEIFTDLMGYYNMLREAFENHAASVNEQLAIMDGKVRDLPAVELDMYNEALQDHKAQANVTFASIRNEFANADDVIRNEFANADEALRTNCEAENTKIREEFAAADLVVDTKLDQETARAIAAESDALAQAKTYTDETKAAILGSDKLNETYDTLTEIATWIDSHGVQATQLAEALAVEQSDRQSEDAAIRSELATKATELSNDYIAKDTALKNEIIAYLDEQLGVIINGSY